MPKSLSKEGYEIHFATNTLGNYYLAKKILYDLKENSKMIFVSSLSANFYKIDFSDFQSSHCKSKMKIYALSKRFMIANTVAFKKSLTGHSIDVNIVHPGVCATELFTKSHSKLFNIIVYPLMKLLFHSPKKASLNIIKGLFIETKENEWIVPGGLFGVWGYPKIAKMKKNLYEKEVIEQAYSVTNNMIIKHCGKL